MFIVFADRAQIVENCVPEDNEPLVSLHSASSTAVDEKDISSSFADGDQITR